MRKVFFLSWALFVLAAPLHAQQSPNANLRPLVFTHVTVIDGTGALARPNRTVVITGDRITDMKRGELVHEKTTTLVKLMQSLGVGLLAGSDSGASNDFTFPGWPLHRELELLVESGLSPMEALQTATRNPARFLGELPRNGTVEPGKTANLVLLTANPLEDIRNTRKIDAVVLKGKLLTRADLDKLLQDVATKAAIAAH